MDTGLFDYDLPEELIAQRPSERRDGSRLLVLDRESGASEIRDFRQVVDLIDPGDALIFNDTKVMKARMYARKNGRPDGALFEILLLNPLPDGNFQALIKPGKRATVGTRAVFLHPDGTLNAESDGFTVVARLEHDGGFAIAFDHARLDELLERYGHIPLPPYIRRGDEAADFERYQTIFARHEGAVAAPTAGLHFTPEVLRALEAKGVATGAVTLHVGVGTFRPVSETDLTRHHMHREFFILPAATAALINATRAAGKRVVAVGTTTVRTLESCAAPDGVVTAQSGATEIFLYPPYRPRSVDVLLTNFHLPKSTLLMLVSCFADREKVLAAYRRAIAERLRFFSYGDCMMFTTARG